MTRQFKVTVNGREYDVSVLEVTPLSPVATSTVPAGVAHDLAIAPHPAAHSDDGSRNRCRRHRCRDGRRGG